MHGRVVTNFADEAPQWATILPHFRELSAEEHRGFRSGMAVTLPFADMQTYLGYLHSRLTAAGGRVETRHINTLTDLAGGPPLVNATGAGARELCGDTALTATRGVHVVVENVGIDEFRMEATADPVWTNIFPYPSHIRARWCRTARRWSVRRRGSCCDLGSSYRSGAPARRRGGNRPTGRVATHELHAERELDDVAGTPCVHAYGHGGIGVTVSWGVADDVAQLLSG